MNSRVRRQCVIAAAGLSDCNEVMGKTYRRNPYARELQKKQYRGRHVKDKRRKVLDEQMDKHIEESEIICFFCKRPWKEDHVCSTPQVKEDEEFAKESPCRRP